MNCKPGDLAVIIADSPICRERTAGLLVTVVRFLGVGRHIAPDGIPLVGAVDSWLIELPRKLHIRTRGGDINYRRYAACSDAKLRPIRPGDVTDSEVRELFAPKLPEVA